MRWTITLSLLLLTSPVMAWNEQGHRALALLAERRISASTKAWVEKILSHHPDPGARTIEDAAVWPDRLKSQPRYSHPTWHYANPAIFIDDVWRPTVDRGEALVALNKVTAQLKSPSSTAEQRAVALCWVLHLVGDIHQPLHAGNGYSKDFPDGDRGGNSFEVFLGAAPTNLHSFWDSAGGLFWKGANRQRLPSIVSDLISAEPPSAAAEVRDPKIWLAESHTLALKAYKGVTFDEPLSADYVERARLTGKTRLALAGYRLGKYLERLRR